MGALHDALRNIIRAHLSSKKIENVIDEKLTEMMPGIMRASFHRNDPKRPRMEGGQVMGVLGGPFGLLAIRWRARSRRLVDRLRRRSVWNRWVFVDLRGRKRSSSGIRGRFWGGHMTTPAIVKSADLKRMGNFVKANPGLRVEVEKNGILIRVAPDIPAIHSAGPVDRKPEDFTSLAEWQAWRDQERAREVQRHPQGQAQAR